MFDTHPSQGISSVVLNLHLTFFFKGLGLLAKRRQLILSYLNKKQHS